MKLHKDSKEFIESLNSAKVKYLIVGAYAVGYHGHPRTTGDMDVFIEVSDANARQIEAALSAFGFSSLGLTAKDFLEPDTIVQMGLPPNRIDLVTGIDGVEFEEAWASRVDDTLDGVPVHLISKELLIRNKRAAGRPKDVADAHALEPPQPS
jgi:hypothetical protein